MATYLDFEQNVKTIEDELLVAKSNGDDYAIQILEDKLQKEIKKTYSNLTDFQKLKLARHPDRPYALDYINKLMSQKVEIFGDRHCGDDKAIVCFLGFIGGQQCVVIGEQKGRGVYNKIKRNFGMPNPEGYRKALRAANLAKKFDIPVLMLVDTPGAYPGLEAEERSQSEAIAKNLFEFSDFENILISVVIGEGGSGGALAISMSDRLAMMKYSVYSVISPEGCASILWKDQNMVESATNALRITSDYLKEAKLIDDIIDEPLVGAHRQKDEAIKALGDYFLSTIGELQKIDRKKRLKQRYDKFMSLGSFGEFEDSKKAKKA